MFRTQSEIYLLKMSISDAALLPHESILFIWLIVSYKARSFWVEQPGVWCSDVASYSQISRRYSPQRGFARNIRSVRICWYLVLNEPPRSVRGLFNMSIWTKLQLNQPNACDVSDFKRFYPELYSKNFISIHVSVSIWNSL